MNKLLMVAFHFPPLAGSSGIQRTLRFAQHLPAFGWEPLILSAQPRAYERISDDLCQDIPQGTVVRRAFALDTARHLSIGGRYLGAAARPDRWMTWQFDAVRQGLRMIQEFKPKFIWSTYPIATAHIIGARLHQRTGTPWIADFRDPMAQEGYPVDPLTWNQFKNIESQALAACSLACFTTPGAASEYRRRYPNASGRIEVIENGYDEETFSGTNQIGKAPLNHGAVTLLHSGIVYPSERDPTSLIRAIKLLHDLGKIRPGSFKLRFRASAADGLLRSLANEYSTSDYLEILPPIAYRAALTEMIQADGLLIMQASNCNAQIPAKLYEYLRAKRPIVALTDPSGDTAGALRSAGVNSISPLDDAEQIAKLLVRFLEQRDSSGFVATDDAIAGASRRAKAEQLASNLDSLVVSMIQ